MTGLKDGLQVLTAACQKTFHGFGGCFKRHSDIRVIQLLVVPEYNGHSLIREQGVERGSQCLDSFVLQYDIGRIEG